ALWAIVIAATLYLLVAGRGLLLPFVLGLALWYMVDALADALEHPPLGRLQKLLERAAALAGIDNAPTLDQLFDRISLADTLSSVAAATASVVSVAGIVLIYA